ncbi:MAG: nuclease superfamily protein, partial [Bacillus sp. (in: firmicutes)]|nr:nuclease superfamily protein [Bacillus sp. (in: firmicutes)]
KSEALKAEYEFKQWSRKKKEEFLLREVGGEYVAAKKF